MSSTTGPGRHDDGDDTAPHRAGRPAPSPGSRGSTAGRNGGSDAPGDGSSSRHGAKTRLGGHAANAAPRAAPHAAWAGAERASSATEDDRRNSPRRPYEGTILIIWHHRPNDPIRLETLDVSEGGARVRTTCVLPEGMTGTAIELLGRPAEGAEGNRPGEDRVVLERILIGRTVTVAWSKAVRREDGKLDHLEAGLRFF